MARRGQFTDFLTNFNAGYTLGRKLAQDQALSDLAKAPVTTSQGLTQQQRDQMASNILNGDQNPTENANGGITTTNTDTGQSQTFQPQTLTDIAGKQYVGDADQAMRQARADTVAKFDPSLGSLLQDRNTVDQANQVTLANAQDARAAKQGQDAIWATASQDLAKVTGGAAPTYNQMIDSHLQTASAMAKAGYGDVAQKLFTDTQTMAANKIKADETARMAALPGVVAAAQTGNYAPAMGFLNEYAAFGNTVTGIADAGNGNVTVTRVATGSDKPQEITIPAKQLVQTLAGAGSSQGMTHMIDAQGLDFYRNAMVKQGQERINATNAKATAETATADAKGTARVAQLLEQNPNASKADQTAAYYGVSAAGDTSKMPAVLQLAEYAKKAGLAKTDAEALQFARTNQSRSPQDVYADILGKLVSNPVNTGVPIEKLEHQAQQVAQSYVQFRASSGAQGPAQLAGSAPAQTPGQPPSALAGSTATAAPPSGRGNGRIIATNPAALAKARAGATEADIEFTAKQNGTTPAEVRRILGIPNPPQLPSLTP